MLSTILMFAMWSADRVPIGAFIEIFRRMSPLVRGRSCARLGRRYAALCRRLDAGPLAIEYQCKQGTPYWHSLRKQYGVISGSNAAKRCGLSKYAYPATEAQELLGLLPPDGPAQPGDRDPWEAAKVGTEREPVHARNFALAVLPRHYRALTEIGFLRHPTIPWMSTSPDRILPLHPSAPFAAVELKERMYGLPIRPVAEHIVQVSEQMETLGVGWLFLSYQTLDGNVVFLVERSDAFWSWALARFRIFQSCVQDSPTCVPTDGFVARGVLLSDGRQLGVDLPWIAPAIEAFWDTGIAEDWIARRFAGAFEMPPEPPWRLVCYRVALDKEHANYTFTPRESSRSRTVRPATIVAAIGALFDTDNAGEAIRRVRRHAAGLL